MDIETKKQIKYIIAMFLCWMILLMPVNIAEAFEIVSGPTVVDITHESARINFTTDIDTTALAHYGNAVPPSSIRQETGTKKEHSITLTGLSASTLYVYEVIINNGTDSLTFDNDGAYYQFTTQQTPDTTPPHALQNLTLNSVGKTTAVFSWQFHPDDTDTNKVNIYKGTEQIETAYQGASYTAQNLEPETTYTFKFEAVDESGNKGPQGQLQVTTKSENYAELLVSNVQHEVFGTQAVITWQTNLASGSAVSYGTNPTALGSTESVEGDNTTVHEVTLTDLQANTNYSYKARSCDIYANCGESSIYTFETGEKYSLELEAEGFDGKKDTILYWNTNLLNIKGKTAPYAKVDVYVNEKRARFARVKEPGDFEFKAIGLNPNLMPNPNVVKIVATDSANTIELEENVLIDYYAPEVEFDNITEFTDEQRVKISGKITESFFPVTLDAYVLPTDTTPPLKVENLQNASITSGLVALTWDDVNVTDLHKYIVYRSEAAGSENIIPIAVVDAESFSDNQVSAGGEYTYQISALDTQGNEGEKSDPVTILTLAGAGIAEPRTAIEIPDPTLVLSKSITKAEFSENIPLAHEGTVNNLQVVFTDQAGNSFSKTFNIIYDTEPPRFIQPTSLAAYSPAYTYKIRIAGQVDDNATIKAYVEGSLKDETVTNSEGRFEVEIPLFGKTAVNISGQSFSQQETRESGVGTGGEFNVRLVAIDAAGHESELTGTILREPCGVGSWWHMTPSDFYPASVDPDLVIRGFARLGFIVDLEWIGPGVPENARVTDFKITDATLSQADHLKFDNNWISGRHYQPLNANKTRWAVSFDLRPPFRLEGSIMQQRFNVSNYRREGFLESFGEFANLADLTEEYYCLQTPGLGCLKLNMIAEISFHSEDLVQEYQQIGSERTAPSLQKSCIVREIPIDYQIPPKAAIPDKFLKLSIGFLNGTINFINSIYDPIETVTEYSLYICMGMQALSTLIAVKKSLSCKFAGFSDIGDVLKSVTRGGKPEIESVAEQGLCKAYYSGTEEKSKKKQEKCKSCQDSIDTVEWWLNKQDYICDRLMCPSVPSFQKHIRESYEQRKGFNVVRGVPTSLDKLEKVVGNGNVAVDKAIPMSTFEAKGASELKPLLTHVSDCEFVLPTKNEIKKIYELTKKPNEWSQIEKVCSEPHVFQPACCAYDYVYKWNPAAFMMDEMKLSYCTVDPTHADCGTTTRLIQSTTGICEPSQPNTRIEKLSRIRYNAGQQISIVVRQAGEPTEVQQPDQNIGAICDTLDIVYYLAYDADGLLEEVRRGCAAKRVTIDQNAALEQGETIPLGTSTQFLELKDLSQELVEPAHELEKAVEDNDEAKRKAIEKEMKTAFKKDLLAVSNVKGLSSTAQQQKLDEAYQELIGTIGVEKEYVLDPGNSFVHTIFTICLTGLLGYLGAIRAYAQQWMWCFQKILETGDGSAGACDKFISQTLCDLLWDLISCLTQKYGGTSSRGGSGGIGNFFGAFADAGSTVTKHITDRYGRENLLTSQFGTEQLIHDACVWAFLGEWPTDYFANLKNVLPLDIEPLASVSDAERIWNSIGPDGQAVYVYDIAAEIYAGSEIADYKLKLICSGPEEKALLGYNPCSSMNPDQPEFSSQCDCETSVPGAESYKERIIQMRDATGNPCPRPLPKQQMCSAHVIERVISPVRYDHVYLEYKYKDKDGKIVTGQTDPREIRELGPPSPSLCSFNIALGFRCGVDLGSQNIARILKVEPTNPAGEFSLGDTDLFDIEIQRQIPDAESDASYTDNPTQKFLVVTIKNHLGQQVYPVLGAGSGITTFGQKLDRQGTYTMRFYNPNDMPNMLAGFQIDESHFNPARSSPTCAISQPAGVQKRIEIINNNCETFQGTDIGYLIYDNGTAFSYTTVTIDTSPNLGPNADDVKNKLKSLKKGVGGTSCTIQTNQNQITCGVAAPVLQADYLTQTANRAGNAIILYNHRLLAGAQATDRSTWCLNTPQKWTATFEIRDAKVQGGVITPGPTAFDPITNLPVRVSKEFFVRCEGSVSPQQQLQSGIIMLTRDNPTVAGFTAVGLADNENIQIRSYTPLPGKDGFTIDVDVNAAAGTAVFLRANLTALGFSTDQLKVEKSKGVGYTNVSNCGTPPCISSKSTDQIELQLKSGDLRWKFSGLKSLRKGTGLGEQPGTPTGTPTDKDAAAGKTCKEKYSQGACFDTKTHVCTGKTESGLCPGDQSCCNQSIRPKTQVEEELEDVEKRCIDPSAFYCSAPTTKTECGEGKLFCPENKILYPYTTCQSVFASAPGKCINKTKSKCMSENSEIPTVSGLCPGPAQNVCCPSGQESTFTTDAIEHSENICEFLGGNCRDTCFTLDDEQALAIIQGAVAYPWCGKGSSEECCVTSDFEYNYALSTS